MDVSIFQIADEYHNSGEILQISLSGFKSLLSSLLDTAIAQNQPVNLWVKLPSAEVWQAEIERFCSQAGSNRHIYCCIYDRQVWSNTLDSSTTQDLLTPVILENSNLFKGEFFVIASSQDFRVAVVAQRRDENSDNTRRKTQLSTIVVTEDACLAQIAAGLQQAIPDAIDIDSLVAAHRESSSGTSKLLAKTLMQVLTKQDRVRTVNLKASATEILSSFTPTVSLVYQLLEELRGPLTTMKTALKLVGSENLKPPQRQRYVQMLDLQCDRQTTLVSGLLEFIQLQQAIEQASLQALRLSDIIPVVVSTYQPLAQEKGIQLGYTVPEKLPEIIAFEPWIKQIAIHLLHNSIKFTPPGGKVLVLATEKEEFIELEVRDTGISISSQDLPRIFEWFYRTRTTGEGENTGSGIGLAIVQSLLESCGGSISVTSRSGQGSSFKVLLPTC